MTPLPYFWLGHRAEHDGEVLMTYEMLRIEEEGLDNVLPDFVEIQDDE